MEDDLGVRRALDVGEQAGIDGQHEVAADGMKAAEVAVVDEQPAAMPERMAVGLLHRRPDRRAHVGEEERRLDVRRDLAQVRVAPGGRDAGVQGRAFAGAVPAEAEAVAVGGLRAQPGVQALIHDPVMGLEEQLVDQQRLPEPRHPAAHRMLLAVPSLTAALPGARAHAPGSAGCGLAVSGVPFGQVDQGRLHPPADLERLAEAKLQEDRIDVLLDRPLRENQLVGDPLVA